jgi:hypothetical protein
MDRAKEMHIAQALNEAIWLRDNVYSLEEAELLERIKALGSYSVFSSRQLSAIVDGKVPHGRITKIIGKTDKTGGNLNVGTLDILRSILVSRATDGTDYSLIAGAVSMGTSQGMVAKLTGVPQGSISKKIKEKHG